MRSSSPFLVDVHELLDAPRTRRQVKMSAPLAGLQTSLARLAGEVDFDLTLESMDGGILVQGTMSGELEAECRRCLASFRKPFSVSGAEMYRPPSDVWEEGYVLEETNLDLELFAHDCVGLEMPSNPICRPDCAGLCSRCGADLNQGACDCPEEVDIRWEALRARVELSQLLDLASRLKADRSALRDGLERTGEWFRSQLAGGG
jgi:uncharacterized protein